MRSRKEGSRVERSNAVVVRSYAGVLRHRIRRIARTCEAWRQRNRRRSRPSRAGDVSQRRGRVAYSAGRRDSPGALAMLKSKF